MSEPVSAIPNEDSTEEDRIPAELDWLWEQIDTDTDTDPERGCGSCDK